NETMSVRYRVPEVAQVQPEAMEEDARHREDRDGEECDERGEQEERHVALTNASLVQATHALGIYEDGSDLEPHEERRSHARPALVEEVDHRRVGADGDDERRTLLEREQHGQVL